MSRILPIALSSLLFLLAPAAHARGEHARHGASHAAPIAPVAPIDGDRGGSGRNAAGNNLRRLLPADYADGVASLAGPDRPSARRISNEVFGQPYDTVCHGDGTDFIWQWGQFVDHDVDLTGPANPPEPADIPVPLGDPFFDPLSLGGVVIPFDRSAHDPSTGADPGNPRQQKNQITGWIDASNVYGSDGARALALRTRDGTGRLATGDDGLLPWNDAGFPNAGGSGADLFLAGDVRANEQVALTALHTLFVREHNRLAEQLAARHPRWDGERLYQESRRIVIAEIQAITYGEFLPALLGPRALPRYRGYRRHVDPRITNVFSTAAYRFGHSMLSPLILRIGRDGAAIPEGPLPLRNAFFNPQEIVATGIDPILRGLARQACQTVDAMVIDDVRNFLFGAPGSGGFDLVSLNIQRGRDHGLPSYNEARVRMGFPAAADWSDVSSDPDVQARLAAVYDHVDDVDVWVGGLSEDRYADSHLGSLFHRIVAAQFLALRDGDAHYFERVFRGRDLRALRGLRLSHVIRWNTGVGRELPSDVFHVH